MTEICARGHPHPTRPEHFGVSGRRRAPRAPEQVRNIEKSFANALPGTGWGMTETNAIGTGIGGVDYLEHPESSGRCSAVMELKVIDEKAMNCRL